MAPWLLLLSASAACVAAVRERGGARLDAAAPLRGVRRRGGSLSAVAAPTTTATCGLTTLHYAITDFDQNAKKIKLGSGAFGVVHAVLRADAAGSAASPLEARALAASGGYLAVKSTAGAGAGNDVTREVALGLLVCSGAACPPGSPFSAFIGTVETRIPTQPDVATERAMGVPLSAIVRRSPMMFIPPEKTIAWEGFLARHALPEAAAPPALRNLDGVLAAAAQMALAVARLHEVGIVHHDIKPGNTMVMIMRRRTLSAPGARARPSRRAAAPTPLPLALARAQAAAPPRRRHCRSRSLAPRALPRARPADWRRRRETDRLRLGVHVKRGSRRERGGGRLPAGRVD